MKVFSTSSFLGTALTLDSLCVLVFFSLNSVVSVLHLLSFLGFSNQVSRDDFVTTENPTEIAFPEKKHLFSHFKSGSEVTKLQIWLV